MSAVIPNYIGAALSKDDAAAIALLPEMVEMLRQVSYEIGRWSVPHELEIIQDKVDALLRQIIGSEV